MCHAGNIALILSVEVQLHLHSPHIWTLDQQSVTFKFKKRHKQKLTIVYLKKKKKNRIISKRRGKKAGIQV